MGCCCSRCHNEEEDFIQEDEVNERTRLLADPVTNHYTASTNSADYSNNYQAIQPHKSDEQTALNAILQKTASTLIDVGAVECHTLEQNEYIDRAKVYSDKLKTLTISQNQSSLGCTKLSLKDVSSADKILSSQPISMEDYNLMIISTNKILEAMNDFRIDHKEDLVVPFGS